MRFRPILSAMLMTCVAAVTAAPAPAVVTLPLSDDGTNLRVPIEVFGETRLFIVDIGSSHSTIDSRYVPLLGPKLAVGTQETSGADVPAVAYRAPKLTAGGMPLELEQILADDLTLLRQVTGEACDGILGLDVLAHYVVELDFSKKTMVLAKEVRDPIGDRVPIQQMGPVFGVRIDINNTGPITAMLDTAASTSVSLSEGDWNSMFTAEERGRSASTVFAAAGGQIITTRMIRVRELKLGSRQYHNLICTLVGSNAFPNIGLPLLRQHRVIFDFPGEALFLSGHKSAPEEKDMSGLHLLKIDGKVVVQSVDSESPAAASGVQPHDVIVSVDKVEAHKSSMNALRQQLTHAHGAKRVIVISRNGETLRVTIQLRRAV